MRLLSSLLAALTLLFACSSGTSASSPSFCVDWCTAAGGKDAGACTFTVSECAGACNATKKWFEEVEAGAVCRSEWLAFKECIASKGSSLCTDTKACTGSYGAFRTCTAPSSSDDQQFVDFWYQYIEKP